MQHLIRKHLLDCTWDADDLGAAAEFWLRLYEAAARDQGCSAAPAHAIEIRLRGFPRHQTEELRDEISRRLTARDAAGRRVLGDFPSPAIDRPDADTLSVTCGLIPGHESPPVGLGLPLLVGVPFDGLFAEVRVQANSLEGLSKRRPKVHATLVLVGELREGRLLLKGMWRTGATGCEDDLGWAWAWAEQDEWLAALDDFRQSEDVPKKLAKKLFIPRDADYVGRLVLRLIHVPLGKPRLKGVLIRTLFFCLFFGAVGLSAYEHRVLFWLMRRELFGVFVVWLTLLFALLFLLVLWLASHFLRYEARVWFQGYRNFRNRYAQHYETAVNVVPLPRAEAEARLDNPWIRKYTSELEAAGFRHLGDCRHEPELSGDHVFRVFCAPDGVSYLNLLFFMSTGPDPDTALRMWPANVAFLAHTFFSDGGWVSSVNGLTAGYRKKRTGADHLARVFVDALEPIEFGSRHMASADKFAKDTGRTPLAHERFDQYLERHNALQEQERKLFAGNPYTWGDHVRWYIQSPRWEYRL